MKLPYYIVSIIIGCSLFLSPVKGFSQGYIQKSELVKKRSDGRLVYKKDADGFLLPDFSYSGYHSGDKEIPAVATVKTINAISGDNTANIQAAIDEVGQLAPNSQGIRGAILLKAGKYGVTGTIEVKHDGVILRGEGNGSNGTVIEITGNSPAEREGIILGTIADGSTTDENYWLPASGTKQNIIDNIVPVGALAINVSNASAYNVGDLIIIHHPCTNEWVAAIGGGGSQDANEYFKEGQVPIYYHRYITAKTGNRITIDAPIYYTLDKSVSQSYIYKTTSPFRKEIGIENLRVDIKGSGSSHAKNAIKFRSAENCWAKDVIVTGFSLSGFITESCTRTSIINCQAIDPIAPGGSGYKYNFNTYAFSQLILFKDCYAKGGRHNFISNGTATSSGIVFQNCLGDGALETSEGHRHWTQAMLFDNHKEINIDPGNAIVLGLYNRNKSGSGHGYGACQSVLWNCDVTEGEQGIICLHQPPTSQNYAIGCIARLLSGDPGMASRDFPEGYIESHNIPITDIPSLYLAQLSDRQSNGKTRVEAKPGEIDEDIKGYTAQNNLIEEGFNGATWTGVQGGASVKINIKNVGTGNMILHSDCAVNATDNKGQKYGFTVGSINLNGQGSDKKGVTLEFPEVPSCGIVTVNVKCNANKTLILQKKVNGRWGAVGGKYTSAGGDYESFTFTVNSTIPVTLRLNSELSSAFYIFDLVVTDFIQTGSSVPEDPDVVPPFYGYVNFSTEPGIFTATGAENPQKTFADAQQNGFMFSNVIINPSKTISRYTGSCILQNTAVNGGVIVFPISESAGMVTVVASSENSNAKLRLEKEVNSQWTLEKEFILGNANAIAEYSHKVNSEDECKFRIVNTENSDVEIYEVVIEPYSKEENDDDVVYTSKEVIHEQFNTTFNNNVSQWTDKETAGNYTFTIPVGTSMRTMKLTNCIVGTSSTQAGATSLGRVRLADATSLIELPEIPSCGIFKINVNAGTATGKSITLQKKSESGWSDLRTFTLTDVPATVEYELNSLTPVTLRLMTKQAGAKNVYELWVTDYEIGTAPTNIDNVTVESQGNIVNTFYYSLNGMQLYQKPSLGFFIQKTVYDNGMVKVSKGIK